MQKIQLAIPEPCHENWHQMTPTEQGRFCGSCAKEVVDFSMMTDTDVLNYFSTVADDKVCGRVLPSQLNRNITMPKDPKKRLFWYWNYVVMLFMFFSKSIFTKAQTKGEIVTVPVKLTCTPMVGTMIAGINVKAGSNEIKGKIVDEGGLEIPFASVIIKSRNTGISADQHGLFSIKVMNHDLLEISALGFVNAKVDITDQKFISVILKRNPGGQMGDVVVYAMGGVRRPRMITEQRGNTVFEVKDNETGLPLNKASFIVSNINSSRSDSGFTDNKGVYKLIRVANDGYDVRVMADGYEANEFTITSKEFNERKNPWQISLKKKIAEKPVLKGLRTPGTGSSTIRLGGISVTQVDKNPIYVWDGTIIRDMKNVDPGDIENVTVLQGPGAVPIYGSAAMYGAIIMNSKKSIVSKVKNLDTVKIKSDPTRLVGQLKTYRTGAVSRVTDCSQNSKKDVNGNVKEETTVQVVIYPNPVQRGNLFAVALQLKEKGDHRIQITNALGEILLQKQVNAVNLAQKEMIRSDSKWTAGIYYLSVFDNKTKLVNKSSFIVQ